MDYNHCTWLSTPDFAIGEMISVFNTDNNPLFADLFTDIDLYSNRLGNGDQKQSDTISSLVKEIDKADLLLSLIHI